VYKPYANSVMRLLTQWFSHLRCGALHERKWR